jgi:hypothetical protein
MTNREGPANHANRREKIRETEIINTQSASPLCFHSCNPCNPRFRPICFHHLCLFVLIRGYSYFLYAGASGNAGGSKPSSSSSSLLNARTDGVTTRGHENDHVLFDVLFDIRAKQAVNQGMLDGFRSVLPDGGDIGISRESATCRPEMDWIAARLNQISNTKRQTCLWRVVPAENYEPLDGRLPFPCHPMQSQSRLELSAIKPEISRQNCAI